MTSSSGPGFLKIINLAKSRARTRPAATDVNTTVRIIAVGPRDTEDISPYI